MSAPSLTGRCHCGNLSIRVHSSRSPAELGARVCQCTFCRARRLRWTSDPEGRVEIVVADESELSRYRFGTGTANFLICRRCGHVIAAMMAGEDGARAVINIDGLERADEFPEGVGKDFDGEELAARLARRARNWTPATLSIGAGPADVPGDM